MTPEDVGAGLRLCRASGWNQLESDWDLFLTLSPAGCRVAEKNGRVVGTVSQFTPTSQPLGLTAGRHRIELRATGYQTISFDTDIIAGQVIPYQGTMQR